MALIGFQPFIEMYWQDPRRFFGFSESTWLIADGKVLGTPVTSVIAYQLV